MKENEDTAPPTPQQQQSRQQQHQHLLQQPGATAVDGGGQAEITNYVSRMHVPHLTGYSTTNIEAWFSRLEASFRVQGFGRMGPDARDKTKYNVAVMYMDDKLHEQAYDIITNPPSTDRYETLKQVIISKFSASPMARLEQLTSGIQLGDNKPSHLLLQLQRTGATNDQQLIKDLWIQRLPVAARAVIAGVTESSPQMPSEKLAAIADTIVDSVRTNSVESVSPENKTIQKISAEIAATSSACSLESRVANVERMLARIEVKLGQSSNNRSRSIERRSGSRSATPHRGSSRTNNNAGICWYHQRYDRDAQKCLKPCSFTKN